MIKKNVLLTGASGSIGYTIAEKIACSGYNIALHYNSDKERILKLKKNLQQNYHGRYEIYQADLTKIVQIKKLIKKVIDDFINIDVLINNAGAIYGNNEFEKLTEIDFDKTFAVNIKAPFFLVQNIICNMKKKGGRIINISSISAKYGGGYNTIHYGCAKEALENLTKGLTKKYSKNGVLINTVRLGFIESKAHKKIGRSNEDKKNRIDMIPLKRAGQPEDAANMVEYLCSDKSNFITGQIFTVSGGD